MKDDGVPAMRASLQPRASFFGTTGCIIGLLALIAATLPQWALPQIFPPQTTEQITSHVSSRLKDKILMKLKGLTSNKEERKAEQSELDKWSSFFSITAISLALIAISLSVISIARREPRILSGVAAALGTTAIASQVLILAAGLIITVITLYIISKQLEGISNIIVILTGALAALAPVALIPNAATFLGAVASPLAIVAICGIVAIILSSFFDLS